MNEYPYIYNTLGNFSKCIKFNTQIYSRAYKLDISKEANKWLWGWVCEIQKFWTLISIIMDEKKSYFELMGNRLQGQ